jgi:hypothetical protein
MVKMGMSENKQYRAAWDQFPEPLREKCTQYPDSGIDQNGLLPFYQQKNVASAGHYPDNFCSVPGSPCFETGISFHLSGCCQSDTLGLSGRLFKSRIKN